MKTLIVGFPYVRERYFATFRFFPKQDDLLFLLPKIWKAKDGKVVFYPPEESNIQTTRTLFYHSRYPIIGGLLKGWMPAFPLALWRLRENISLVYSCSEPVLLTTLYNGLWAKLFGLKHIMFSWENIPYDKKFRGFNGLVKKVILKLNMFFSDGMICGNKKGAKIHSSYTKNPITIIPMSGLDEDLFMAQKDKIFKNIDLGGKIAFSFIGAIGFRKGIHLILKALVGVLKKVPNAHLVIAGSGEYEEEIERLTEELHLEKYVTRLSWVGHNELIKLLSASDIFLYPSLCYKGWEEQFGYSMAEASLMELPVVSTRSGSIDEVVVDGKTGILIEPDNQNELEEAMTRLATDKRLRENMGRAGRQHIVDNFSHQVVANKFYTFFSKFIRNY